MTLYEAVGRYIDLKRAVLSPSTLTGYTAIQKTYFSGDFGKHMLSSLTNIVVQTWVSDLSVIRSPKTVRNAYGLLSATLDVFMPDRKSVV